MQLIDTGLYWHSDRETPDIIPAEGLAATTRAYAKIIADVNAVDLKDLQRPAATNSGRLTQDGVRHVVERRRLGVHDHEAGAGGARRREPRRQRG